MTLITERSFNALDESGWSDDNQGNAANGSIISDASAPKSPSNILRTVLPTGFTGGGGTWAGDHAIANFRTIYISYWARMSSNWFGGGIHKQFYANTNSGSLYFNCFADGSNPIQLGIAGMDIVAGGTGFGDAQNPDWDSNLVPSARIVRGQWYHIETVLVGNTAGTANGSIDWYLDGLHIGSHSGIQWGAGATTWNLVHYTNLWNGTTVPETQNLDFDHYYVSGK